MQNKKNGFVNIKRERDSNGGREEGEDETNEIHFIAVGPKEVLELKVVKTETVAYQNGGCMQSLPF